MIRTLSDKERADWLQLIRTPNIGPITFFKLIRKYGTAAAVLEILPELSRKAGRKTPLRAPARSQIEDELKAAWHKGVIIIAACEPEYPARLRAIDDPPPIIFTRGHVSLFDKPTIAIIGARNASLSGIKLARTFAGELSEAGYVVTSGLARGIDGAAHEASLNAGTIAVVAGGIHHIYPPEHEKLTHAIATQGLILSERGLDAVPTARDFPRRNRLISGISDGVVIIEAAQRSGTLITARYALEQGREVFAVPGSPLDPRCQGANRLIRDGATLVETSSDIMDSLQTLNRTLREGDLFDDHGDDLFGGLEERRPAPDLDAHADARRQQLRRQLETLLSPAPVHQDEIIRACSAAAQPDCPTPGEIAEALLEMVLSGDATEEAGLFRRSDIA